MHCTQGPDEGRTGTGGRADRAHGQRARSEVRLLHVFTPAAAVPLGCGLSRVRLRCPSSSRPPCLLFLGLSLGIFWATTVRGCLAESPDALQSTCQLQQQGNELKREEECEREARGLPSRWTLGPAYQHSSVFRHRHHPPCTKGRGAQVQNEAGLCTSEGQQRRASALRRVSRDRPLHLGGSAETAGSLSNTCPEVLQVSGLGETLWTFTALKGGLGVGFEAFTFLSNPKML